MKLLTLSKIQHSAKGPYTYIVEEEGQLLCKRTSNREYIACYVTQYRDTKEFKAPFFFSRIDLIGKHHSKSIVPYGLAVLQGLKPIVSARFIIAAAEAQKEQQAPETAIEAIQQPQQPEQVQSIGPTAEAQPEASNEGKSEAEAIKAFLLPRREFIYIDRIEKKAGVSQGSLVKFLNGIRGLGPEAAAKIAGAIEVLGYRSSAA